MISSQLAIARFQRDLTLGRLVNWALFAAVVLCVPVGAAFDHRYGDVLSLTVLGLVWIALGYQSMKGSRLAAGSPRLIAAGQFDQAEYQIEQALSSFSLFRTSKLMSLHHLAVLRHAQRRWGDAVVLCQALLRQRLGGLTGLTRQSRLILAESLLELGDLRGAHDSITALYSQRLSLAEAMHLLEVQLDYLSRVFAWEAMLQGLASKVQLAELMNTAASARTQAFLALAAKNTGRDAWATWLMRRVELLVDIHDLVASRPVLAGLWGSVSDPTPKTTPNSDPEAD
jgi:hypothetical protein